MRFRHCSPRIVVALPVLRALITPTSAFPIRDDRFHQDKNPLPLEVIPETVNHPLFHDAEVPVELKEGTAVPEPALVPNQAPDEEVVDRIYNHEVQPLHDVASTIEGRPNTSENAKAEREPYENEDIAPIEKRAVIPGMAYEDEEPAQSVQPAPSILEEEKQEAQAEIGNPAVEEEPLYHVQKNSEKQATRIEGYIDAPKHRSEDWQRGWESSQNECPKEAWENAPHRGHISEPTPTAKPQEPIPALFDRHFQVPITLDSTTAAEDVDDVDTHAYQLNRFKTVPTTIDDTPDYAVSAHLPPAALFDTKEEDPQEYLECDAMHRLTIPDIKADEPAPTTAPEAVPAEAETPASPTEAGFSASPTYITSTGHIWYLHAGYSELINFCFLQ